MIDDYQQAIIQKVTEFAERTDEIRVVLLTSSLCNPNAPSDILSDFDVELYFVDPMPFVEEDAWIETLGPVMALWHWPNEWDAEKGSDRDWMRMVQFQDGTKMDITLAYVDDLRKICQEDTLPRGLDVGYKVLLDKDGITASLRPPTYTAYILKPPTAPQFASRNETFWMESTYVAKFLWRKEIIFAKHMLQELMDGHVREVLEWRVAAEHGWDWRPGKLGRELLRALDAQTCKELLDSYAAGGLEDLWQSLFRTTALCRETAAGVAESLGFTYPRDLDRRVSIYHQTIRELPKTASRDDLAGLLSVGYRAAGPTLSLATKQRQAPHAEHESQQ